MKKDQKIWVFDGYDWIVATFRDKYFSERRGKEVVFARTEQDNYDPEYELWCELNPYEDSIEARLISILRELASDAGKFGNIHYLITDMLEEIDGYKKNPVKTNEQLVTEFRQFKDDLHRWNWVLQNKDERNLPHVVLENNRTYMVIKTIYRDELLQFDNSIGCTEGVQELLVAAGLGSQIIYK